MASMDQRKWLVGFEPVTSWTGLVTSISPLSPPCSDFTLLSGSGILEGIQLSLLINQLCLHCSDVNDRHQNMLTLTFRLSWFRMQLHSASTVVIVEH